MTKSIAVPDKYQKQARDKELNKGVLVVKLLKLDEIL